MFPLLWTCVVNGAVDLKPKPLSLSPLTHPLHEYYASLCERLTKESSFHARIVFYSTVIVFLIFWYNMSYFPGFLKEKSGPPWWFSGKESACPCRRRGFDPWSRSTAHAAEPLGPRAQLLSLCPRARVPQPRKPGCPRARAPRREATAMRSPHATRE